MNTFLSQYLTQIIVIIVVAISTWLGTQAKNLYKKYITTKIKQSVAHTVVRFVEQVYVDIHGAEKLEKAMEKASAILSKYGILIDKEELVALIEAAVNEFNNAFGKEVAKAE